MTWPDVFRGSRRHSTPVLHWSVFCWTGFQPGRTDAAHLTKLFAETQFKEVLTEAALQLFPDLVRERMIPEIRDAVQALAEAAARVPSVDTLSLAELVLESSRARPWTHPPGIVTPTFLLLHRWRLLTPGLLKTVEAQTVTSHDLSSALVDKWAKRLVSNLLPFRAHFRCG